MKEQLMQELNLVLKKVCLYKEKEKIIMKIQWMSQYNIPIYSKIQRIYLTGIIMIEKKVDVVINFWKVYC